MSVEVLPELVDHWLESPAGFPSGSVGADTPGSTAVVATARGVSLTRRQMDEVLAFTEFLAGRALPDVDRTDLEDDIVDAFEDSPKRAAAFLRSVAGGIRRISSLDPVERAQRRLQALTATYTIEHRRRTDGADASPIMAMVGRYNPMVRYWASTGVVLVADALAARVEQHRLVLSLVGSLTDRAAEEPDALTKRLLDRTEYAGRLEIAELASAEVRLLSMRAWLRDLGNAAIERLRQEVAPAVTSALDVDIVVQQVGYRAALEQAG